MLVLILFTVACVVYAVWVRTRRSAEPPVLPNPWPIIGHAPIFNTNNNDAWDMVQDLCRSSLEADGAVTLYLGPKTIYVLTDPYDCYNVANTCLDKSEFYEFAKPWLGNGLISADVPIWKYHRKLINPAFSQQILDVFLGVFNSQARRLVLQLGAEVGNEPFDHWPYLAFNGLETICLTAMGLEISGEEDEPLKRQYFNALEQVFLIIIERIHKVWLHSDHVYKWTALKRKQDEHIQTLHNMSNKVLQRRKREYNENNNIKYQYNDYLAGGKFKPFLDLLLELASEKQVFTDQEIRDHVDTMIVAGHDTSANSLMYTLVLLGSHPEVQEKVFNELREIYEDSDRDVEKQDICRLVYTEAVIKESLRLYPIFPLITRTIDRDLKIKNYTLTAGNLCFIMLYGLHRHPQWGPDAEEFKPERWLNPGSMPECPTAFGAFSLGKRGCIGKSYAMMSMKTTLVHILRQYKVRGDHTKMKLKLGVMLKAESGHHITLERR